MFHRPVLTDRLFFAIRPPLLLARRIAESDRRAVAAERLHITMFILDDMPWLAAKRVELLLMLGERVTAAPIDILLDRIVASPSSMALRPGANAALRALHRQIGDLAKAGGIAERHGYRFSPHLTLAYRDGRPSARRIEPIGWVADELVLIHSHLGQGRHDTLGRWPLTGPAPGQLSLFRRLSPTPDPRQEQDHARVLRSPPAGPCSTRGAA